MVAYTETTCRLSIGVKSWCPVANASAPCSRVSVRVVFARTEAQRGARVTRSADHRRTKSTATHQSAPNPKNRSTPELTPKPDGVELFLPQTMPGPRLFRNFFYGVAKISASPSMQHLRL